MYQNLCTLNNDSSMELIPVRTIEVFQCISSKTKCHFQHDMKIQISQVKKREPKITKFILLPQDT